MRPSVAILKRFRCWYFTLRQCIFDKTYKSALEDFFTSVRNEGVHSIILDLRGNPGGNSLVANEFIRYLQWSYQGINSIVRYGLLIGKIGSGKRKTNKRVCFSGNVCVIQHGQFQCCHGLATLLSDNGLCMVVGEAPGNMPSSYGDILYFRRRMHYLPSRYPINTLYGLMHQVRFAASSGCTGSC